MTIYATAIVLIAVCAGREATSHGVRRRLQSVTADELAANNSPVSCWIQIDDDAYDVTSYAKDHPGGPDAITKSCGQDVTEKFYANLAHSAPLLQFGPILKGPVVAASPAVQIFQSEVASHDNADSCWLHIGNNAYDVTAYAGSHPGGDTAIQKFCGQEITDIYYAVVSHTESGLVLAVDKGTVVANPVVVASPTPAPTEVPVGGGDLCFSGENTIEIMGKGRVTIDSIKIGDSVRVGPGGNDFSQVYSFGHYDVNIFTEYVQIHAEGSKSPLELSKEHMVFLQEGSISKSVPASAVKVGDKLIVITNGGGVAVVGKIGSVTRRGAFAPFTKTGTIVVSDVLASNYVSLTDEIPVSMQWMAHTLNAPHRMVCALSFEICENETYTNGISNWVYAPLRIFQWWIAQQNTVIKVGTIMPFMAFFGFIYVIEKVVASPALIMCAAAVAWFVVKNKQAKANQTL